MNAYFHPSVNKEEKRWQERRASSARGARQQRLTPHNTVIRNRNPYENNNTVTCKQGKNKRVGAPPPADHSLGKRATKEMRSAKFLITEREKWDGGGGVGAGSGRKKAKKNTLKSGWQCQAAGRAVSE